MEITLDLNQTFAHLLKPLMMADAGISRQERNVEISFQCPAPSLKLFSIQSLNLLTILFCPGVKLLPQVDDFNAKTLLTVRPL